jgi:hypothetical protein
MGARGAGIITGRKKARARKVRTMMNESDAAMAAPGRGEGAPARIRLVHGMEGEEHVFTSPDLPGFRIASSELLRAFDGLEGWLVYLVGETFGDRKPYVLNLTYREFLERRFSPLRDPDAPVDLFAALVSHAHIEDPLAGFVPQARRRREALRQAMPQPAG